MTQRLLLFICCLWLTGIPLANGQLEVRIEPEKAETVSYEAIHVRVTVTNNSARDVVLAAPGDGNWLRFMVTDDNGTGLAPFDGELFFEPMQINAGQTLSRREDLSRLFPMANYGVYRIKASVYYPPLREFISSNTARVNVVNARAVWGPRSYRVPDGMEGAGEFREYSVLRYQLRGRETLYVRITRERDGRVLATFPVGTVLETRQPQFHVDGESQLHMLFLHTPEHYAHLVIGPGARMVGKNFYMETQTRPQLVSRDGGIAVAGGVSFDPERAQEQHRQVTNISERPLGLLMLYRDRQVQEQALEPEADTVSPGR